MKIKVFDLNNNEMLLDFTVEVKPKDMIDWIKANLIEEVKNARQDLKLNLDGIIEMFQTDSGFDTHPEQNTYYSFGLENKSHESKLAAFPLKNHNNSDVRIICYQEGIKIYNGLHSSIFQGPQAYYLSKITSTKLTRGTIEKAKYFSKWSQLEKFLLENLDKLYSISFSWRLDLEFAPEAKTNKEKNAKANCIEIFNKKLNGVLGQPIVSSNVNDEILNGLNDIGISRKIIDKLFDQYNFDDLKLSDMIISNDARLDNDTMTELLNSFMYKYGNHFIPYAIITSDCNELGKMMSILYVSKYGEKWEFKPNNMKRNIIVQSYTYNLNYPDCSEFGDVVIDNINCKIKRTY